MDVPQSDEHVLFTSVLARVGLPNANGDIYAEEALRAAADGLRTFYDEEARTLVHRAPLPPFQDAKP